MSAHWLLLCATVARMTGAAGLVISTKATLSFSPIIAYSRPDGETYPQQLLPLPPALPKVARSICESRSMPWDWYGWASALAPTTTTIPAALTRSHDGAWRGMRSLLSEQGVDGLRHLTARAQTLQPHIRAAASSLSGPPHSAAFVAT